MNKVLFFVLTLLTILRGHSNAQVTYHFQHTGGIWGQFSGSYVIPCPGCQGIWEGETYYLHSMGDTLISGVSYIKIYSGDSSGSTLYFSGAIREDSLGKIWTYTGSANSDSLLYDFNVSAGDTIHVYDPYAYPTELIVDSISTVLVNGSSRKAIFFNPNLVGGGCCISGGIISDELIWVEGIGSTGGLFEPYGSSAIIDAWVFLTCYKQNDSLFFGNLCNVVYTNSEEPNQEFNFAVSPNPSTGNFVVSIRSSNPSGEIQLELLDLFGRIVYSEKISSSQNFSATNISVDQLAEGNYFLRLKSEKYSTVSKLMISR